MKATLTILTLLILSHTKAATYYVSATGNDGNPGTEASPWKSLSKISSLAANDFFLLKRGETFFGSMTIPANGIKIGAYGTGAKPVIVGTQTITAWTSIGSGKYEATVPTLTNRLNVVILNDVMQGIGRYPNTGYLSITSHVGKTITSAMLTSTPVEKWTGAELVLRKERWILDRYQVTAQTGQTISYTGSYAQDGFGFFFQNDVRTLDQSGEWYYNAGKLTMHFGGGAPLPVGVSTINTVIFSNAKTGITIENIQIKGANEYGIRISGGGNIIIRGCDVSNSGIDAITAAGVAGITIENNSVTNAYNNGTSVSGSTSTAVTVRGNVVKGTYITAGMGQPGNAQGQGIIVPGNSLVENNQVINSGYIGIRFDKSNTTIRNNYIDRFGFVKDDAAGVYTYGSKPYAVMANDVITGNIIMNGIGAPEGTNSTGRPTEGIYLDDNANHVTVSNNTASNTNRGIYVHNAQDIIVTGNTFYNNTASQLHVTQDGLGEPVRRITVTNNIFFARESTQPAALFLSNAADIGSWGSFNNNYYARPINEAGSIGYKPNIAKAIYVNLATWKGVYGFDANSNVTSRTVASTNDILFHYNISGAITNIQLGATAYVDAPGTVYNSGLTLAPYTSRVLVKATGTPNTDGPGNPPPPPVNPPGTIKIKTKYKIIQAQ